MGKKKKEKTKKYYTWNGNDAFVVYHDYFEARDAAKEMGQVVDPPGFIYEEEAEAFSKGTWGEYIEKHYQPFDAAKYDAVIYTDGSYTPNDSTTASYGLMIFFRDEEKPYIESCVIQDVAEGKKYKIVRYDGDGEKTEQKEYPFESRAGKSGFVSGSHVTVGELFGAMRSLEICCKDRGLKKILLIYDRDGIRQGYEKRDDLDTAQGDVAYQYRKFLQKLEEEGFLKDAEITFQKIDSHEVKGKPDEDEKEQYRIGNREKYPHAVYNDLVDMLAKAETGIGIRRQEDFNVFRAIPDEFRGFPATADADKRRIHAGYARELIKHVLEKYDGKFRPGFENQTDQ